MVDAHSLDDVRRLVHRHGYHLFAYPDRDNGWWIDMRDDAPGLKQPVEAHAATRDEAALLAERLFVNHRLSELDAHIRRAGLVPPLWGPTTQEEHLQALMNVAVAHGLVPPPIEV